MLNNLLSNAIKFTDKGEVTLLTKLVSLEGNRVVIHFAVRDTGIGIPDELQESIFESFNQVQQSVHREQGGTGLGLTITQKLAKLHNSKVILISEAGKGSEIYFDLSFEIAANQKRNNENVVAMFSLFENKLNGLQVLVVDDNLINLMVAQKQLKYFGVMADCATEGKEALKMLEKNRYHVALLDLHMPGIDGYALAEIIRKEYPEIHIIIFTADIMMEVKEKFAKINVHDILNKPFAPEKMFEVLLKAGKARGVL